MRENFEEGFEEKDQNWANASFACAHRVKFDLFLKYGLLFAAGDRHLVEFMPGEEYLQSPQMVEKWKYGLTTVSWRKQDLQNRLEKSKRLASGEEKMEEKPSGEEGILLIKALCGLERVVSNVNVPNSAGQIGNLPAETTVETNALFWRDTIQPVYSGEIPQRVEGLLAPHVENQQLILQAALECDFELALKAFMQDPLVAGRLGREQGRELLSRMIKGSEKYLPSGWKI